MDIRCERCQTEYEFDESKVTEAGVTVKCTNCGNLFKVRRRPATPPPPSPTSGEKVWMVRNRAGEIRRFRELTTLQAWIVESQVQRTDEISLTGETWKPLGDIAELASFFHVVDQARSAVRPAPVGPAAETARLGAPVPPPAPAPEADAPPESLPASTTIPYGLAARISAHQAATATPAPAAPPAAPAPAAPAPAPAVAAAPVAAPPAAPAAVAAAPAPAPVAPAPAALSGAVPTAATATPSGPVAVASAAMSGTATPLDSPSGPVSLGTAAVSDEPAFTSSPLVGAADESGPAWDRSDARMSVPATDDDLGDQVPRAARGRYLLYGALALVVVGLTLLGVRHWGDIKGIFAKGPAKGEETYRNGRELFLLDTDESFDRAKALFSQADAANNESSLGLAALAEMEATRAWHLLDDAKLLERTGPAGATAAEAARRKAQTLIDEAQRNAIEAARRPGAADVPEVQRAWATIRLALGNPAAAVEADLAKVRQRRPQDPEAAFVEGALRLREGRVDDARRLLQESIRVSKAQTQRPLLRAEYLLARLELDAGKPAVARALLQEILKINDKHARARRLLALCDQGTPPPPPAAPADAGVATAVAPQVDAGPVVEKEKEKGKEKPGEPGEPPALTGSYESLVARGERLQRGGSSGQAFKVFEKALEQRPDGLEALTGLAYCHLDANRYQAAISTFQRAVSIGPRYGEALIGLAEAYKQLGEKSRALTFYKRYLAAGGRRSREAQDNVRELEAQLAKTAPPTVITKPIEAVQPPTPPEKPVPPPEKPVPPAEKPAPVEKPAPPVEKPAPPVEKPAPPVEKPAPPPEKAPPAVKPAPAKPPKAEPSKDRPKAIPLPDPPG